MFLVVKYRAIDYNFEQASVRRRMMMGSLLLPVPMYQQSGRLQDDSYRRPWSGQDITPHPVTSAHAYTGSLGTPYKLEHPGSVLEFLKTELCPVECVERFMVCTGELGKDVVLSSNPASLRCVESQEALGLLNGGGSAAEQDEWTETFTAVDVHSVYFSEQDLFLPEVVFISDNQLKSYLPSLTTLLKRLKPYPLLDGQRTGSLLSEHITVREFSPYCAVRYDALASCPDPQWDIEEFRKDTILHAEDLMLPDFIDTNVKPLISYHVTEVREALKLAPEPDGDHGSALDTLRRGLVTSSEWETFSAPVTDLTDSASEWTISPLPFRSRVELELDLILSPPSPSSPPTDWKAESGLFLSLSHLSAETLSPIDTVCLLSDSKREVQERDMWVAEKHPQCVATLLLAEPRIPAPPVRRHSLPQLLSSLQAKPEPEDTDRSCVPSLLRLMTPDPILTQALTVERHTAVNTDRSEVDTMEQFTPLSLTQIDELLGSEHVVNSALPVVESRVPEVTIPTCVRRSKTVTFSLPKHDSQKPPGNKDRASSKASPAAHRPSKNSPNYSSDASDLLKSDPKPASYTRSVKDTQTNKYTSSCAGKQESSLNSSGLSHPVRATDTNTSLLKSTTYTVTHRQLTEMISSNHTNNVRTSSENETLQTRHVPLRNTYSAVHNYSAKNSETKSNISTSTAILVAIDGDLRRRVPRKHSTSARREPLIEKRNNTRHHSTEHTLQNSNGSFHTPEHTHACLNTPTASKRLLPTTSIHTTYHLISEKRTEKEDVSVQHVKSTYSDSATHTHPSDLLPQTPAKHLIVPKSLSTPLTHRTTVLHTPNPLDTPKQFGVPQNIAVTPTPSRHPHQEKSSTPYSASINSAGGKTTSTSVCTPQECLDPVSSFMMLRGLLKLPAEQRPEKTPPCTPGHIVPVAEPCQESTLKPIDGSDRTVLPQAMETETRSEPGHPVSEGFLCKTILVPPTDTERGAYWELHALAHPVLCRALKSGALRYSDFSILTPEHTQFCLEQQEKRLRTGQGGECEYKDVALLHILVTLKDLLLRCDLNTAAGYLEKAHSTCSMDGLGELLRKFQVLQCLSRKWAEPRLRVQHLQEQVSTWLQRASFQKILIVMAVEIVRTELVLALSQIPGNSVAALIPEQDGKVDIKKLTDNRCAVVCVQQLQCVFPWWRFSAVFEFQCSGDSAVRRICTMNQIHYTCFITAGPCTDPSVGLCPPLDRVPFVLFITEGLLKHGDLLQLLESGYNMTLLERTHPPSLQLLGPTHLYDIITIDENTAILLQDVEELNQERAAERVVLRLSALSLQFSRCWVVLHHSGHYSALVRDELLSNLALIYSALVLFGQKSHTLDVKVLLAYNVRDIARCVHQVCLHTLLKSQRDVCSWLDRGCFSVLPTEEEQYLLYFPSVNRVVAQLLLSRAPSLQWLLEASHTQLEEMFPEITPSVIKLFSDSTGAHILSVAAKCESEVTHIHHWGLDKDESLSDTHSSIASHSPGFIQEPGTHGGGWFGAESESLTSTHSQNLASERTGVAEGCSRGEEDGQWNLGPSSLISSHSFTHSHTVPCSPFTQSPCPPPLLPHLSHQQWRSSSTASTRFSERKRPAGGAIHTVFPQCKRGRLLFERIPGRSDGQTRLRFF